MDAATAGQWLHVVMDFERRLWRAQWPPLSTAPRLQLPSLAGVAIGAVVLGGGGAGVDAVSLCHGGAAGRIAVDSPGRGRSGTCRWGATGAGLPVGDVPDAPAGVHRGAGRGVHRHVPDLRCDLVPDGGRRRPPGPPSVYQGRPATKLRPGVWRPAPGR